MAQWRVAGFDEVRELGRGPHGRTVLARHGASGSTVVVRYLEPAVSAAARDRFRHRAAALGRLRDPRVARPYQLVENAHGTAVVMERVDGAGLREILRRERRTPPEAALVLLRDALLGLASAHAVGVVHGDCTPGDILVRDSGRAVLVDFAVGDHAGRTSPLYRAPELWHGAAPSPASDIYAVTCVFFESVAGHRPYGAPEAGHLTAPVPVGDVPEPLRSLVASGMAKDPRDRPSDAALFADEVERTARAAYGPDWEARGRRTLAALAAPDHFPTPRPTGRRRKPPTSPPAEPNAFPHPRAGQHRAATDEPYAPGEPRAQAGHRDAVADVPLAARSEDRTRVGQHRAKADELPALDEIPRAPAGQPGAVPAGQPGAVADKASALGEEPRARGGQPGAVADEAFVLGEEPRASSGQHRAAADSALVVRSERRSEGAVARGRRGRARGGGRRRGGARRGRGRMLAAAGVAVAGVLAAGGYGIYEAVDPHASSQRTAAERDAAAGRAVTLGRLGLRVPPSWQALPITVKGRAADSFYVSLAGGCPQPAASSLGSCPGFAVMGPSFFDRSESQAYGGGPYDPKDTFASRIAMSCPRHPELVAGGAAKGASQTASRAVRLGQRQAEFHQWRVPCFERQGDGTGSVYTERIWYVPSAQIVVVDAWNTPDLDAILRRGTWP
ncbi:protein kinase domain-containing protein [Actinomadura gamaensis]|uniref:non-specific serine/threonine protein kinase n=1 Tax=Actinomadura gamaensis TaxID=1763541 RepID=A0ABV9U770_9ACTN